MLASKKTDHGFGHRVYKISDPRFRRDKGRSKKRLAVHDDKRLFPVSERLEQVLRREKKMFPISILSRHPLSLLRAFPRTCSRPLFVISRITGWAAHISNNALIHRSNRPNATTSAPIPDPMCQ
jgi:2-methylcitrate synthase